MMILDVMDTGTGVRDHDGRLLEAKEMDAIFQLGYTTKEQGTGEGLGLNWVFQIVSDFHHGEIVVRNRKESGAIFSLHLPNHLSPDQSSDENPTEPAKSLAPPTDSRTNPGGE
jgi:signal transduction histidine kinase